MGTSKLPEEPDDRAVACNGLTSYPGRGRVAMVLITSSCQDWYKLQYLLGHMASIHTNPYPPHMKYISQFLHLSFESYFKLFFFWLQVVLALDYLHKHGIIHR